MKIVTWNVNGVRARGSEVAALLERERPDVLCLQEIKVAPDHLPKEIGEVPGYFCTWHGMKGYSGVALHVREGFAPCPIISHPPFDHETRIAVAEVQAAAGAFVIASIYVPNGGKDLPAKIRFLEALTAWAAMMRWLTSAICEAKELISATSLVICALVPSRISVRRWSRLWKRPARAWPWAIIDWRPATEVGWAEASATPLKKAAKAGDRPAEGSARRLSIWAICV